MAGRPKTRAKQLEQALRLEGRDPEQLLRAVPNVPSTPGVEALEEPNTRGRTPTRAKTNPIGPATRHAVDNRTALDLDTLAHQLQPGLTVRLERLRPTWAAGWVEDVAIDDTDLGGLLDYVAQEHGGQVYRATVLASDGSQLYTARVPVSGPPRRRGRIAHRDYWEGAEPAATPAPATVAAPVQQQGLQLPDLIAFANALRGPENSNRDATLEAVREMASSTNRTVTDLLGAVVHGQQRATLREQLTEFQQTATAVMELREVVAGDAPQQTQQAEPPNMINDAIKQGIAGVIGEGIRTEMGRRNAAPQQQQPTQQQPPTRPANFRRADRGQR